MSSAALPNPLCLRRYSNTTHPYRYESGEGRATHHRQSTPLSQRHSYGIFSSTSMLIRKWEGSSDSTPLVHSLHILKFATFIPSPFILRYGSREGRVTHHRRSTPFQILPVAVFIHGDDVYSNTYCHLLIRKWGGSSNSQPSIHSLRILKVAMFTPSSFTLTDTEVGRAARLITDGSRAPLFPTTVLLSALINVVTAIAATVDIKCLARKQPLSSSSEEALLCGKGMNLKIGAASVLGT